MKPSSFTMVLLVTSVLACFSANVKGEDGAVITFYGSDGSTHTDRREDFGLADLAKIPPGGKGLSAVVTSPGQVSQFYVSPDEKWAFNVDNMHHYGLQDRELYEIRNAEVSPFKKEHWFSENVERYALEHGVFRRKDLVDERSNDHLQTDFRDWSFDSARFLIALSSGGNGRNNNPFYVYFNTKTRALEQTAYLRAMSKMVASRPIPKAVAEQFEPPRDVVCVEPIAALPLEAELKTRIETLEPNLKNAFDAAIAAADSETADNLHRDQAEWVKARDSGETIYLSATPSAERERRRLQFETDAAAARIKELTASAQTN